MANNRTPFYSTVAIVVIILYILCQSVVSIPISVKPPRINIQSHTNEVTIEIFTDNQIYEKVSFDAYEATAEFPTYNTYNTYNPISSVYDAIVKFFSDVYNSIANFFSDIYNAVVKFFSDNYDAIVNFITDAYNATVNFITDAYNATVNFITDAYNATVNFIFDAYNSIVNSDVYKASAEFVRNHVGLTIGIIIMVVFIIFAPHIVTGLLRLIGFGINGIVENSLAAIFMASYYGRVAVGSACAILQSAGAMGVKGFLELIKIFFKLSHRLVFYIFHLIIH